jgi:hypothetical protein
VSASTSTTGFRDNAASTSGRLVGGRMRSGLGLRLRLGLRMGEGEGGGSIGDFLDSIARGDLGCLNADEVSER